MKKPMLSSYIQHMLHASSSFTPSPSPSPLVTTNQPMEKLDLELQLAPMGFTTSSNNTEATESKPTRSAQPMKGTPDLDLAPLGTAITSSDHQVLPNNALIIKRHPHKIIEFEQDHSLINEQSCTNLLIFREPSAVAPVNMEVPMSDPWVIKKRLEASDVNKNMYRLLLKKEDVMAHIKPYFSASDWVQVEGDGLLVKVLDDDSGTEHSFKLKKWPTGMHSLQSNWRVLIESRDLKVGEMVGLYWDIKRSIFHFTILSRI